MTGNNLNWKKKSYVAQSIGSNLCESLLTNLFIGSMTAKSACNCDCFLLKEVLVTVLGKEFVCISVVLVEELLPPDRTSPMKRKSSSICRIPFSETREFPDSTDERKFS